MNPETILAKVPRRVAAYMVDVGIAFVGVLALQAACSPSTRYWEAQP